MTGFIEDHRDQYGVEPRHIPAVFLVRVAPAKPRESPRGHGISGNKKPALRAGSCLRIGGAREDRTPDLVIANDALSQLSYGPERGGKS